jgi:hypothetical protein
MDKSSILKVLLAIIAVVAAGITIRIVKKTKSRTSIVSQKGNTAGGDIVAGDKNERRDK